MKISELGVRAEETSFLHFEGVHVKCWQTSLSRKTGEKHEDEHNFVLK